VIHRCTLIAGSPRAAIAARAVAACLVLLGVGIAFVSAADAVEVAYPVAVNVDNSRDLSGVACPSATQCTGVDYDGYEVTFNPQDPGTPAPVAVADGDVLHGVACESTIQCTAVGYNSAQTDGEEVTFDPQSGAAQAPLAIGSNRFWAVACPAADQCTAVSGNDVGQETTFDPQTSVAQNPVTIDSGHDLYDIACTAADQCTAVDDAGSEITFDPQNGDVQTPGAIDTGDPLNAVACTAGNSCTAVDDDGRVVTFDPANGTVTVPVTSEGAGYLDAVACPTAAQCTALAQDNGLEEQTFDPASPSTTSTSALVDVYPLFSIACPAATQCTAVDDGGREVTFNPLSPNTPPTTTTPTTTPTTTTPPPTTPTTTTPPPTTTTPPPAKQSLMAGYDNQQITLIVPAASVCVAPSQAYDISFNSATVKASKRAKLKFRTAAFYIDKGIAHTLTKTEKLKNGKKRTVKVTTYTANATVKKAASVTSLKVSGLKAGGHTLKAVFIYAETIKKGHKSKTVNVTKTMTARLSVC
jgi:hypothetical protein